MKTVIEKIAEQLRIIPKVKSIETPAPLPHQLNQPGDLSSYPPPEKWDNWEEYDAQGWARRKKRSYRIIPTVCFNCEAGCGLLAYVDRETNKVKKFEGNPYHPGSRGRNCAKGPATINQINDQDRILYPMKRTGKRGEGKWERISWEQALDEIASRIRQSIQADKRNEVVYHVGRPGHEGYIERVLKAWGVDGHNSHTNICSSGARLGYVLWDGYDRPSPDFSEAKTILLISAHLEAGHYFNPHAQRIIEGKNQGAKLIVVDTRLSNTASRADSWLATYPGTEAALLLAMAKVILEEGTYDLNYIEQWVNWRATLTKIYQDRGESISTQDMRVTDFITELKYLYREFTPEFAEAETGVDRHKIIQAAQWVARAGSQFACHNWRSAGSGNLGGWSVARCLQLLNVLTGSVGTKGGTSPSEWSKFHPQLFDNPPPVKSWNELHFPDEYPLSHFEMSQLLPHFLKEGRGRMEVYFTRVFNPVWTYPDGFTWIEALSDESKVGLHVALTPTWNETAYYADMVLPMGHSSERHDLVSYETHSGVWVGFRQPIYREIARRMGQPVEFTYEVNPGEVWEEDELWIELSWRIDPDGELGIRQHFESPYREGGKKITIDEYYQYIFERVDGLPEIARKENLTELEYMKKYGAFKVAEDVYELNRKELDEKELLGSTVDPLSKQILKNNKVIGLEIDGKAVTGFKTPSKQLEFYSPTMTEWGWDEYSFPSYIKSHIHQQEMDFNRGDFPLIPTYRLPTLIHSRSGNSKWLNEISNRNPLWMHPSDMERLKLYSGELVRVNTEIGYFVVSVWETEGIRPQTVCCSHHLGRWRRKHDPVANQWATALVDIEHQDGKWTLRKIRNTKESQQLTHKNENQQSNPILQDDPDLKRIFWKEGGVHQNITFPVHPDPISGMHCWHQKVRVEKAKPGDQQGDIMVDTKKSMEVYRRWLAMTRPGPGKKASNKGLRRPLWLKRPLRPSEELFYKH